MLKFWINAVTDEGFTASHFASFKGNIVSFLKYQRKTFIEYFENS